MSLSILVNQSGFWRCSFARRPGPKCDFPRQARARFIELHEAYEDVLRDMFGLEADLEPLLFSGEVVCEPGGGDGSMLQPVAFRVAFVDDMGLLGWAFIPWWVPSKLGPRKEMGPGLVVPFLGWV